MPDFPDSEFLFGTINLSAASATQIHRFPTKRSSKFLVHPVDLVRNARFSGEIRIILR